MMKKRLLLSFAILLVTTIGFAQVGIGTINIDPSAMLDVVSTDKGFLPPRVANVAAIAAPPVAGLMVYDESDSCMRYYNGTIWSDCMGNIAPTVTDIDGNTYPTVLIDEQIWMAADLKVSHYPNGDPIPYIDSDGTWAALGNNNTDDAYSFYGDSNDDGTVDIANPDYGALYTYSAAIGDNWTRDNSATDSEGGQGVCPDGWHLPTDAEWTILTDYLGGLSVAGGEMKETGTTHWISNTGATNNSGFTALPGGFRYGSDGSSTDGTFTDIGIRGIMWSSTESSGTNAYYRRLLNTDATVSAADYSKSYGFCVRCLKD